MPKFSLRKLFVTVTVFAFGCFLCMAFMQAHRAAMEASHGMSCGNNIRQVGLAVLNYESAYRSLPPAIELGPDGKPWRSWRSRIYPSQMAQMPNFYDPTASWDSPNNMRILDGSPIPMGDKGGKISMVSLGRRPLEFRCPSCLPQAQGGINYVVVVGESTAFPRSKKVRLSDITDGLENTILVVESITCTPDWTEPRDLDFDSMSFVINSKDGDSISSRHPNRPWACFADNQVCR